MQTLCGECECGSNMQAVAFSSTIAAAVLSGPLLALVKHGCTVAQWGNTWPKNMQNESCNWFTAQCTVCTNIHSIQHFH